ncbi:DUF996 domain-containing protein [Candidatus Bathyarchaeota archaeon]|nr:DUF996 domain-containing protein [Candidatus Bathyarchaeota archaeon]
MSVESNKSIGGIGALLIAIGFFIPFLTLVGIILVFIALKGMADAYGESGIFQNALYGIIFLIVGTIASIVVLMGAFFGLGWSMTTMDYTDVANLGAFFGTIIIALVILFVFYLLSALFFKKSFDSLGEKSGEKLFHTAGMLMLVGAILTIVGIGLIILLIAWIIAAIAFFSMKATGPQQAPPAPPPPP